MIRIGLIGCGKMGAALLRGLAGSDGVAGAGLQVALCDAVPAAVTALAEGLGYEAMTGSVAEVVAASEVVILAVKPGDMQRVCEQAAAVGGGRLFVSIAAGIQLASLEGWLGAEARVIRAMPNTPALVAAGAAAFARGSGAGDEDARVASLILGAVGLVDEVPEKLLDAVTGLSGSGPAYVYMVIEAMADGGVLMGLPRAAALRLAAQTVLGAARMVVETGRHPAVLRDEVTSPGGTTIAGLEQLELAGLRAALQQAVRAATERSVELG